MSYCYDFIKKFKKEGNFCGLDKSEVSRLEAYIEIIEMLMKQHLAEKTIIDNFPLGAARYLIPIKDERRADGLSFVTEQLKAGKHISGKDIQKKLEISNNKPETKQETQKEPHTKAVSASPFQPATGSVPVTDTPPQPPLAEQLNPSISTGIETKPIPCLTGKSCDHIRTTTLGRKCDMINLFLNQLSECPFDMKARKASMFTTALDMAKPVPVNPIVIKPVTISPQQAGDMITSIVRGHLTPVSRGIWEDIRKSGDLGESDLDIFQGLIDEAGERMGV